MFRIFYILQNTDTGEFLSSINGQLSFDYDLSLAFKFIDINDALQHLRNLDSNIDYIKIHPLVLLCE